MTSTYMIKIWYYLEAKGLKTDPVLFWQYADGRYSTNIAVLDHANGKAPKTEQANSQQP